MMVGTNRLNIRPILLIPAERHPAESGKARKLEKERSFGRANRPLGRPAPGRVPRLPSERPDVKRIPTVVVVWLASMLPSLAAAQTSSVNLIEDRVDELRRHAGSGERWDPVAVCGEQCVDELVDLPRVELGGRVRIKHRRMVDVRP